MKKAICFVVFAILLCSAAAAVKASKIEIGAKFELEKLAGKKKTGDATIVAFVPSLTYDCEYASMLTQSFYYYFDRGMAFDLEKNTPDVRVFLVVNDARNEARSTQNITGAMNIIYDEKGDIFSDFGIKAPGGKNGDSTVVLLDSKEKVVLIDEGYRAQGEHLKPLEYKLKALNGSKAGPENVAARKTLKVGDRAVDFKLSGDKWLSHFRGDVILLSFYPAAFSGTFPKPAEPPKESSDQGVRSNEKALSFDIKSLTDPGKFTIRWNPDVTSCSFQITALSTEALETRAVAKRIVISGSTAPLLEQWQQALKTENIIYANDPDYSISRQYSSFNPAGYNNRVSVIIDQKGKIAYIDNSFEAGDEVVIEAKIAELLKKK